MNMFELFKYMNGPFVSKSKYMNGVGFQILAYKSISKSPVDTPPPPEAWVLNTSFVYHFCMLILQTLNIEIHITVLFHLCHSFPIQEPLVRRKSAAVKLENEINHHNINTEQ